MTTRLAAADRIFMDETTAPVLDPGRRRTKKGFFWAIASDDRGHSGADPPVVLFRYAPGRGGIHGEQFLQGFRGKFLQRSEEHTSELQSLMRISYAVFCLKKKTNKPKNYYTQNSTCDNQYIT